MSRRKPVWQAIAETLKREGRTVSWLAIQIQISNGHLNNILKGRAKLSEEHLQAINKALKTEYELY